MTIREIAESDRPDWVRLRDALWPGSLSITTPRHGSTSRSDSMSRPSLSQRLMGGSWDSWNWTTGTSHPAVAHPRCDSSRDGMSSLRCNGGVSAGRWSRRLKRVRAPWDIMRLPAIQKSRTPTASLLIGPWDTRKWNGLRVSVDRYLMPKPESALGSRLSALEQQYRWPETLK